MSDKKKKNTSYRPAVLPPEVREGQSVELLKALHILTRDGQLNQDSRRKLKQVYHLYQFIEPLLQELADAATPCTLADHGAGKSYLGFILYDLFFKQREIGHIFGIETRQELVQRSQELAEHLQFPRMSFLNLSVEASITSPDLPAQIDMVTALHACNTATDDAIRFALHKKARFIAFGLAGYKRGLTSEAQSLLNAIFGICPITSIDLCFDTPKEPNIEAYKLIGGYYRKEFNTHYINAPALYGIDKIKLYNKALKDGLAVPLWRIEFTLPVSVSLRLYEPPIEDIEKIIVIVFDY